MQTREVRKLLREPVWMLLAIGFIIGAALGTEMAHEPWSEGAYALFGRAWRADATETRAFLGGVFGFEITILTLLLSLNAMVVKSAAYQYSARLIPIYLLKAPTRRSLPLFALLAGYLLAAMRELGLLDEDEVQPRFVTSFAVVLLLVALAFLIVDILRTFRFLRVERVLGLARDATYEAARRVALRVERLPLDPKATLELPLDASALVASDSGYLVDVEVRRLSELAQGAGVRARISHAIGDYLDEGDVIGWVASDAGGAVTAALAHELTSTLVISPVREIDYDPGLGIRVIVDIANRSLSSSYNDPYTARQALNQLRSVLRHVRRMPLGDWNIVDRDGRVRVSISGTRLRDLLSLSVVGPLYYGSRHPDVIEGLLAIAHEVGWIARDPEDREAARKCIERIDRLADESEIDPDRLARLRAEAMPVRRGLAEDQPPSPG
jgi:uncharacterized membrane protein